MVSLEAELAYKFDRFLVFAYPVTVILIQIDFTVQKKVFSIVYKADRVADYSFILFSRHHIRYKI